MVDKTIPSLSFKEAINPFVSHCIVYLQSSLCLIYVIQTQTKISIWRETVSLHFVLDISNIQTNLIMKKVQSKLTSIQTKGLCRGDELCSNCYFLCMLSCLLQSLLVLRLISKIQVSQSASHCLHQYICICRTNKTLKVRLPFLNL